MNKRNYELTLNVTTGKIKIPSISIYNTDKGIFNIKLFLEKGEGKNIVKLTHDEMLNYKALFQAVKSKTKNYVELEGILDETENFFYYDLGSKFNDQVGVYNCQIFVTDTKGTKDNTTDDEIVTSVPFNYTVTASILTGLNAEITANPDLPVLQELINECKILMNLDSADMSVLDPFQKKEDDAIDGTDKNIISNINSINSQIKEKANTIDIYEKQSIDAMLRNKRGKLDKILLEDLSQEVKEAMTGGSVAVVGEGAVEEINLQDASVSEQKLNYIPQKNFLTNGIKLYARVYEHSNYVDIRIISTNNVLYYYASNNSDNYKTYTLNQTQFNLSNYNSLIWNLDDNVLEIIADGTKINKKYIKLLHNSVNNLDSGVLLEYVKSYDKNNLYKSQGAFCYFEKPNSLYVSTKGKYVKKVWLKWDGNITIREYNNLIASDSYVNITSNLTVSNSLNENSNCITLDDGECFVYKYSVGKFYICAWQEFNYKDHILLLRNTDGCPVDGLLINHINNNVKLDTEIEFKKIPKIFDNYIEQKKIEVIKNQNENTVCLSHISDIHTTEFTGYQILQGVNILNEFCNTIGIQAIMNSGDNIMYENNKADSISNSMRLQERINNKTILLNSIGNHDSNGWNDSEIQNYDTIINDKELYAIHGLKLNDYVVWGDKLGMYYYYDVPNSNVRIITLNSCDIPYIRLEDGNIKHNPNFIYNYSQKQIDFLINTLKNSNDKHVLINAHIPLLNDSEGYGC